MVVDGGSATVGEVAMVRCRGVEVAYDQGLVLHGADLQVEAGEFVSIMGASGSGKSTLLLCLAGLLPPSAGEVVIAGTSVYDLAADERTEFRRQHVGLVFQFGQLVAELTAGDNVALPVLLEGASRDEASRRAGRLLEQVGLGNLGRRYPSQLSGGQRQRVAVARALATGPAVLLADEPTGSLDSVASREVLDLLRGASREAGAALVLVTHDPGVAELADRQVVLRDGVLLGQDTPT